MNTTNLFSEPQKHYSKELLKRGIKHKKNIKRAKATIVAMLLISFIMIGNLKPDNPKFTLEDEIAYSENTEFSSYYNNLIEDDDNFWNLNN